MFDMAPGERTDPTPLDPSTWLRVSGPTRPTFQYARVSRLLLEVGDNLGGEEVEAAHDLLEGEGREVQEQGKVPAARL